MKKTKSGFYSVCRHIDQSRFNPSAYGGSHSSLRHRLTCLAHSFAWIGSLAFRKSKTRFRSRFSMYTRQHRGNMVFGASVGRSPIVLSFRNSSALDGPITGSAANASEYAMTVNSSSVASGAFHTSVPPKPCNCLGSIPSQPLRLSAISIRGISKMANGSERKTSLLSVIKLLLFIICVCV